MSETDTDPDLGQQRQNFDLLLRAQSFGRTGYIVSDAARNRVYWSDSLFDLRKVPRRPYFTREEGMQYIHPDYRDAFNQLRERAIRERRGFEHEMRIVCGDGSQIWERGSSQPQFDAQGNFTGLFSVVHDITESKTASASLMEQEATYRTLFNGIGDSIFLMLDGRFVDCNDAALRMFGCSREQIIGEIPARFSPELQPDGRLSSEKAQEKIAGALRGERQSFEWRHKRFDNVEFEAEVTLTRVGTTGEPYFFSVVRDISERKRAEAAVKASYDKLAGAFNASTDAMIVARIGGEIGAGVLIDANDAARRIIGFDKREMIGKTIAETGIIVEATDVEALRRELLTAGSVRGFQTKLGRRDGAIIEVEISGSRYEADGEQLGIVVIRDVTEQHAADRKIQELNASLQSSLRQLAAIADNLPVAIGHLDVDGKVLYLNKTAERWLQRKTSEIHGLSYSEAYPQNYLEATRSIRDAFRNGETHAEATIPFPDGQERSVETINVMDRDESGQLRGYFNLTIDISERKRAEDELRASHEKFASAFEYSTDAMMVTRYDHDVWEGIVIDANRSAQRFLEVPRERIIGGRFDALKSNLAAGQMEEFRRRMTSEGDVRDMPLTLSFPSGVTIHVLISAARFGVAGQNYMLAIVRNVSEAVAAERKIQDLNGSLEASLRQLRAIADNIPVAIAYQDADGRFRFTNRTMESWFASDPGAMLGKTVPDLVSQAYLDAVEPIRERVSRGSVKLEWTLPFPDGVTRIVEATMIHERTPEGLPKGRYTLLIDLTERKAAEEQFQQSQKMQAIGKLTGGVAHDFNNLLGVISGNLELASDRLGDSNPQISKLLEPARRAAERGSTLTRSLLSFARQQPLSPQVTDLNGLARDMTELTRRTLPSNIGIEFVGGAGLWTSEVDPGQLQNALLNLVVNARDAMPDGGRLTVETRNTRIDGDYAAMHGDLAPGQYVMLAVSDTGTGMPPEVIARAFEPFYTTKGLGQGTGLGLSMVYGFAKQSGGHVAIYSEVGSGTTVKLYLPRWIGEEAQAPRPAESAAAPAQNETLLVVEDDEDMRFVAVTMLRSLGYTVLEANTGAKALDLLARHADVALLVTDVVLAGSMNGRRLAEEAKARRPDIEVLYMSGYTEDAIVHHGRLDHGVHFIQKPFRKQDLAAKAREALAGRASAKSNTQTSS